MYYNNLTMLTDLYELTMAQGYLLSGNTNKRMVFDLFFRSNPDGAAYSIVAGLEQVIEYVKNLEFTSSDIEYLRSLNIFKEEFLEYLKCFRFRGDIYAIPEGSVVFPHEPLLRVHANIIEAQLIESAVLNIINHQSLIATKARRIVHAAGSDKVLEFGLRRAQGPDAAIYGSRAAIIGGCFATSNVMAGKMFNVPTGGTHAHSWVMSFENELQAFMEYAKLYPENCFLLVDTYDTMKSGVPNAIKVFDRLRKEGYNPGNYGVRLDSGDLAYLSKKVRSMLDSAGHVNSNISASGDLDEDLIFSLKSQESKITIWGVGTNLITSSKSPAFGGVYKLAAEIKENSEIIPKIKLSENPEKITNPGIKTIMRLYEKDNNKIKADLICLHDEIIDESHDLTIFHPVNTWKKMTLKSGSYYVKNLLVAIFLSGECVYKSPSVMEIAKHCEEDCETLWNEYKRLVNPHVMPVDLSLKLFELKSNMINQIRSQ